MNAVIPGGTTGSLSVAAVLAAAPAADETGSSPPGADFQSLISQIYPGNPANQFQSGVTPDAEPAADDQAEPGETSAGVEAAAADPAEGGERADKTSADENVSSPRTKSQNPAGKNAMAGDDALAGSVMALMAQIAVLPKQEIPAVPKEVAAPAISTGGSSPSHPGVIEAGKGAAPEKNAPGTNISSKAVALGQTGEPAVKLAAEDQNQAAKPSPAPVSSGGLTAGGGAGSGIATGMGEKAASDPAVEQSAVMQSRVAGMQASGGAAAKADGAVSRDGTSVALDKESMNNTTEKNEIAGRAVKKLPRDGQTRDFSAGSGAGGLAKAGSEAGAAGKESADLMLAQEIGAKGPTAPAEQVFPADKNGAAAAQVEQVTQLVTQEAITVRQSGATSLAVSLKVDSQTRIFVQLSNANGQMQASISCEKGSLEGLGSHWNELQESLARQNIQLLPLASASPASGEARTAPGSSGGSPSDSSNFQQSPGNSRRQTSETRELPPASDAAVSATNTKPKAGASAIKGWESWA